MNLLTNLLSCNTAMATSLSCKCCSRNFTDPRLLPCLHIFCKDCLEPLYSQDDKTITCPTCNKIKPCPPPSQLPRQLRKERELSQSAVQQTTDGEIICGSCDENNKAVAYCEDCITPICTDCNNSHKKIKAMKNHTVVPLDESQPVAGIQRVPCMFHPEEVVKYFCSTCSCLVCSECLFAHKEHDSGRVDNAELLKKEKDDLREVLPNVEAAIAPFVKATDKINEVVKRIKVNKDKAKDEIEEIFRQITEAVDKRRIELTQEVENSAVAKSTLLEKQRVGLEKVFAGLELAFQSGSDATENYSGVEVLSIKGTLLLALNKILEESHSVDLQPITNSSLSIAIDATEPMELITSLGSIVMGFPFPALCGLIGINPTLPIGIAKGSECVLALQTRDEKGEDIMEGMAKVAANVIDTSTGSEVCVCDVTDLENGSYEISFDNQKEGEYHLNITIDEVAIGNSPFTINVRDYTSVTSPLTSSPIQGSPAYVDLGPDNLHYFTLNGGSVEAYDSSGKKVKEIPSSKLGNKPLRGIVVDKKNGVMFLATADKHQIIKATLEGDIINSVGGNKGNGQCEFYYPMGLCLTREGLLLVAEDTNKRVQVIQGSDLSFVRFIPCLSNVYGVSVDGEGNIHAAVTDKVEVFSINGDKITEYGNGVLTRAGDVAFLDYSSSSKSPYSFVTDHVVEGQVHVFDWSDDKLVHSIPMGKRPLGLTVDQEGTIVVGDWNDKKFHRF